jgi:phosphatidylserine/phosphatidylglycerophosphate/cardiolipin synthase-like enzyme
VIEIRTLTDGGQKPLEVARQVEDFLGAARRSLDLALYDFDLTQDAAALVGGALTAAAKRGIAVRLLFNVDHEAPIPVPPPPKGPPSLIDALEVPTKPIAGEPDLMHHKYVIRDAEAVWTGSTNWTDDSWSRQENVIAVVHSERVAAAYAKDFEQLWTTEIVAESGDIDPNPINLGGRRVRTWFSPGRGEATATRFAHRIARAKRRIRIASPVITSAPILGALAEAVSDGRVDIAGIVDATQMREVYVQWEHNGNAAWKLPLVARALGGGAPFSGKPSTPYGRGDDIHDFMHAKMTVTDDVLFVGSYNLSHSGELNAENVLEVRDAELADRLATYVDEIRSLYPAAPVPQP